MKRVVKIVGKIIYYLFLIVTILSVISIVYNKIKYPKSPYTIFKYQLYVDVTNSMSPNLNANDILVIKRCNKDNLKVGDIVTFREGNITVTHRIVEIIHSGNQTKYKTKGDNNNLEDERLITYEEIEGEYLFKIRYLGFFITDKVSFVLLVFLILVLAYFPYHKLDFSKEKKDSNL